LHVGFSGILPVFFNYFQEYIETGEAILVVDIENIKESVYFIPPPILLPTPAD
jgi:hypothetical protein